MASTASASAARRRRPPSSSARAAPDSSLIPRSRRIRRRLASSCADLAGCCRVASGVTGWPDRPSPRLRLSCRRSPCGAAGDGLLPSRLVLPSCYAAVSAFLASETSEATASASLAWCLVLVERRSCLLMVGDWTGLLMFHLMRAVKASIRVFFLRVLAS